MLDAPAIKYWLTPAALAAGAKFETPRTGDAGFDLRAIETCVIQPGKQMLISTGLHLSIPLGWVGIVKDRSSMAIKRIYSHAGVIDASYRGEVKLVMSNAGDSDFLVECAMKVAQLIVVPHAQQALAVESLEALGASDRGQSGFGSTGKS